jgi:spoIIIJ-associated protein
VEWVNVTAKSLPEAIDLALDNLGVDEAEAEIEVLEEPKQGLFGRTRGNARVKARVKPRSTRPKVERGRNRRRRDGGGSDRGPRSGRDSAKKRSGSKKSESRKSESKNEQNRSSNKRRADNKRDSGKGGGSGTKKGRGGRSGNGHKAEAGGGSRQGDRSTKNRESAPPKEAPVEEVSATIESFLSGLTDAFGLEGGVQVVDDGDDGLIGQVEGRHGLLVGPRGRTLDAIQELTRVTAQRTAPSSIRIKVDVGGYRQMRAEALQTFALEAADAAKADGKERSLEPMSSADRKVVHDALSGIEGIETRSAGTDPRRRVIVVPTEVASDDDADDEVPVDDGEVELDEAATDEAPVETMEPADTDDTDTDADEALVEDEVEIEVEVEDEDADEALDEGAEKSETVAD